MYKRQVLWDAERQGRSFVLTSWTLSSVHGVARRTSFGDAGQHQLGALTAPLGQTNERSPASPGPVRPASFGEVRKSLPITTRREIHDHHLAKCLFVTGSNPTAVELAASRHSFLQLATDLFNLRIRARASRLVEKRDRSTS